jgi:hypothetical protein
MDFGVTGLTGLNKGMQLHTLSNILLFVAEVCKTAQSHPGYLEYTSSSVTSDYDSTSCVNIYLLRGIDFNNM